MSVARFEPKEAWMTLEVGRKDRRRDACRVAFTPRFQYGHVIIPN